MSVNCVVQQKLHLSDQTRKVKLTEPLYYNNQYAHAIRVTCLNDDDTPADLTGVTCEADFVRPDGATVHWIGTVSGSQAEVILPKSCYLAVGRFKLTVQIVQDLAGQDVQELAGQDVQEGDEHTEQTEQDGNVYTAIRTALCIEGSVERNQTDTIVDPAHVIPSLHELIEMVDECEQATEAANTAAQNADTAREGIQDDLAFVAKGAVDIDTTQYPEVRCTISDDLKTRRSGSDYRSRQIPRDTGWDGLRITGNAVRATIVCFLTTPLPEIPSTVEHDMDVTPYMCESDLQRHVVSVNTTAVLTIPADCAYILIAFRSVGEDCTPAVTQATTALSASLNGQISDMDSRLTEDETSLSDTITKSLMYRRQTTSSDDIDTMWDVGVYYATSGGRPAHSPTVQGFLLVVIGRTSSTESKRQLLFNQNNVLFTRYKYGTTVSEWVSTPLEDTWSDKIDALSTGMRQEMYSLLANELPVDSVLVKGAININGGVSSSVGVCTYPIYYLTVGTKINITMDDDMLYSVMQGNSRTVLKRTARLVSDESITTTKPYIGFTFYKTVDGETVDASVDDIKGHVTMTFDTITDTLDLTAYVRDTPANQGVVNVLMRAAQVVNIPFEALADIPHWSKKIIAEGTETNGIPYSSVRPESLYVPNCVSFETFMTATKNPKSYLYTKKLAIPGYAGHTYYGSVCSSFVAWCYGIDDVIPTTISFDTYPGFTMLDNAHQNVKSLQLGDMLNKSDSHIVIVTAIYRNQYGNICYVEISEETNKDKARARSVIKTAKQINSYLTGGYKAYRYDNIADVTYTASPWIHVDESEWTDPTWNQNIMPRRGNKANWPAGSDVEIDILDQGDYTGYELKNIDTGTTTTGTISGDIITLSGLAPGRYRLRLTASEANSGYVYFDVVQTQGTTYEVQSGRKVKVTPYTTLGTMASVSFCISGNISDYMAVRSFHVFTAEEIAAGYAVVDAPEAYAAGAPDDVWLMKVMYKTEFGLYSSQLTAVQVTSIGTVTEDAYRQSDVIVDIEPSEENG